MTDAYVEQQRRQLAEARAELAELRRRYDDEHATAVARAHETERVRGRLAKAEAERDQFAAGLPLICSDERHAAKVRGLEALLVAGQKATTHWEEAYAREVAAHGVTERALREAEARIAAARKEIAYQVRAELVCCDVYGRVNDRPGVSDAGRTVLFNDERDRPGFHDICYWGEAAARLAEGSSDGCDGDPETLDGPAEPPAASELHARCAHPGWEYATTEGPRKQWDDAGTPPCDDNGDPDESWERNVAKGIDGWERFDYTEESYWRRPTRADGAS